MRKTAETAGGGKVTIETRDGQDRGLTIGLEKQTDNATQIESCVGAFGDRGLFAAHP